MRTESWLIAIAIGATALTAVSALRQATAADTTVRELIIAENEEQPAADNSGRNVRDREDASLTPGDQGSSESDLTITQQIRKAVVADDSLSMNAKNVKIITVDSVVTFRGPVKSAEEKARIASLSRKATGVKRVDDQIEVEAQR